MKCRDEDGLDSAAVRLAASRLAQIAPGDSPETLLGALEPCMRVAAGLLMVVKPGLTTNVTHHALRIPMPLVEGWMHTQPDYFAKSLFPAVRSNPGDFWSETDGLSDEVRRGMEVLHILDRFGLGEGAGLKLLRQPIPGGGEEHVVMALLTHRGDRFPRQIDEICRLLAPALEDAVGRLRLPFTVERSIHAQIHEEDAVGFICLGADGAIIELNQRAYELAAKYRDVAQVHSSGLFMNDFVNQAVKATKSGIWRLTHPTRTAMMQIRMHKMPKERFTLSRDLPVLKMEEWSLPSVPEPDISEVPLVFHCLTEREREIAMLLLTTGNAPKQIAAELAPMHARSATHLPRGKTPKPLDPEKRITVGTVRKHIENIHEKLKVHSFGEFVALVRRSRN